MHSPCVLVAAVGAFALSPLTPLAWLGFGSQHAAMLDKGPGCEAVIDYTTRIRAIMHALMVTGKGTKDLCGTAGLTTEEFVDEVRPLALHHARAHGDGERNKTCAGRPV
jgi:hypothetical protein